MKKTVLFSLLLVILSSLAYAQKKDSTKLLCKRWVMDTKMMIQQFGDKPEFKRMVDDLKEFDVAIEFFGDGKAKTYEGREGKETDWGFSPDKKKILLKSNTIFTIKELTAKKFVFTMDRDDKVSFYMTAVKPSYKLRMRKEIKEEKAIKREEPKEEKKE